MSNAVHDLANVRASLVKSTEKAEAAHSAHSALLVRKAEAEAKSAGALTDYRAGCIDEPTAALRKASADADLTDITALIAQSVPVLAGINEDHQRWVAKHATAEQNVRREELQMTAVAMDAQIKVIEQTLLEAIQARYEIKRKLDPRSQRNLGGCYRPTPALQEVVNHELPPRA